MPELQAWAGGAGGSPSLCLPPQSMSGSSLSALPLQWDGSLSLGLGGPGVSLSTPC